jgi:hypothetical protein
MSSFSDLFCSTRAGLSSQNTESIVSCAARRSNVPLSDEARLAWEAEFTAVLERHPHLAACGKERAYECATRAARLFSGGNARLISLKELRLRLMLWQYMESDDRASSKHGIVFDDATRSCSWSSKTCRFRRALGRYRVFQGLVMASGRPLSPQTVSELYGCTETMSSDAIRCVVSRVRQSLRVSEMAFLADSIVRDRMNPGHYVFKMKKFPK